MIVQFSINPMDSEHISDDIKKITAYLEEAGVEYQVGPIGTSIQGEWETIMPLIRQCHLMVRKSHKRLLTNIAIDDHMGKEHSLDDAVEAGLDSKALKTKRPSKTPIEALIG